MKTYLHPIKLSCTGKEHQSNSKEAKPRRSWKHRQENSETNCWGQSRPDWLQPSYVDFRGSRGDGETNWGKVGEEKEDQKVTNVSSNLFPGTSLANERLLLQEHQKSATGSLGQSLML